jgi:hypothetical protein
MQAKQAATVVVVSLALPIVLAAPADAAPYLHLSNSAPSKLALSSVPHAYLSWYQQAARTCSGLPWPVLAGIGEMESDHGQSTAPGVHSAANFAGAEGPMQFEPGTFTAFAVRADRSRALSPYDPKDAIYTAAHMLCADGARGGSPSGIDSALFAYNHADWYPPQVMSWAAKYATSGTTEPVVLKRVAAVRAPARRAVVVHTVMPRRAPRVIVRRTPRDHVAPHVKAAPHVITAPRIKTAPHEVTAPRVTAKRHAAAARHKAAQTQTGNPLAPVGTTPVPTVPVPPVPSAMPSVSPAVPPAAPATAQPSQATPAPVPPVTPSATAQQLAAEAQQLSADAQQLSNEAQQLSAEAGQLSGPHGPAEVTPAPGSPTPAQAQPAAAPSADSSLSTSAGAPPTPGSGSAMTVPGSDQNGAGSLAGAPPV